MEEDINNIQFPKIFQQKVNVSNVNSDVLKFWINQKIKEILKVEDESLALYIYNILNENGNHKKLYIYIFNYLGKQTMQFLTDLWSIIIDSEKSEIKISKNIFSFVNQKIHLELNELEENLKFLEIIKINNDSDYIDNKLKFENDKYGKNDKYDKYDKYEKYEKRYKYDQEFSNDNLEKSRDMNFKDKDKNYNEIIEDKSIKHKDQYINNKRGREKERDYSNSYKTNDNYKDSTFYRNDKYNKYEKNDKSDKYENYERLREYDKNDKYYRNDKYNNYNISENRKNNGLGNIGNKYEDNYNRNRIISNENKNYKYESSEQYRN